MNGDNKCLVNLIGHVDTKELKNGDTIEGFTLQDNSIHRLTFKNNSFLVEFLSSADNKNALCLKYEVSGQIEFGNSYNIENNSITVNLTELNKTLNDIQKEIDKTEEDSKKKEGFYITFLSNKVRTIIDKYLPKPQKDKDDKTDKNPKDQKSNLNPILSETIMKIIKSWQFIVGCIVVILGILGIIFKDELLGQDVKNNQITAEIDKIDSTTTANDSENEI